MIGFTRPVQRKPEARSVGSRRSGFQPDVLSPNGHGTARLLAIVLLAAGCEVWPSRPAVASPIKHSHPVTEIQRLDAEIGHSWAAYLMAGPSVWSKVIHPAVTPDLRASIWKALGSRRCGDEPDGGFPAVETEPRPGSFRPIPPSCCSDPQPDFHGKPGKPDNRADDVDGHRYDPDHTAPNADPVRSRAGTLAAGAGDDRLGALVAPPPAVSVEKSSGMVDSTGLLTCEPPDTGPCPVIGGYIRDSGPGRATRHGMDNVRQTALFHHHGD